MLLAANLSTLALAAAFAGLLLGLLLAGLIYRRYGRMDLLH